MSSIIVQKYGGTSVGTPERIKEVAKRVIETKNHGNDVIVVVSAMGDTTDDLLDLAHKITERPSDREMDMLLSTGEQISIALLALAINSMGYNAISFTGAQVGIVTDSVHRKAKIQKINPDKMIQALKKGNIVIVAGFQGVDYEDNITTLGRGGSDTTAVALAAVVKAKRCEIYTDVEGVFTCDPRIVPEAKKMEEISYDEMLELAQLGAKVMNARAMEFAAKYDVPLYVLSSFSRAPGTLMKREAKNMENIVVRGIAVQDDEAKVTIQHVPDKPGIAAKIFKKISDANINIDMIVQNISEKGVTDISFTVVKDDLRKANDVLTQFTKEIGAGGFVTDENMAKISVVGYGMHGHTGVAARMFDALAREGINIEMISTSEIKISVVIEKQFAKTAAKILHKEFEMEKIEA
jgi:aspartate kinase